MPSFISFWLAGFSKQVGERQDLIWMRNAKQLFNNDPIQWSAGRATGTAVLFAAVRALGVANRLLR